MKKTRLTSQRIKILEYLKSDRSHPTAERVFEEVRKGLPAITLATVYRNLNMLADSGQITRLEINKEYHYDFFTDSHQHFICENCDSVIDVDKKDITEAAMDSMAKEGHIVEDVTIYYRGICRNCIPGKQR